MLLIAPYHKACYRLSDTYTIYNTVLKQLKEIQNCLQSDIINKMMLMLLRTMLIQMKSKNICICKATLQIVNCLNNWTICSKRK